MPHPISSEQFMAFNQQLAQLTRAGLPVEQGLRLVAEDLGSSRLADATRQIADELARGQSLAECFEHRRSQFPPLYGRLLDAGVKTNNLPDMLFNLGRHLEMVRRLKASLWRAFSYPLAIFAAFTLLLIFLGLFVLPKMHVMFVDFKAELPLITQIVLEVSRALPAILVYAGVIFGVLFLAWIASRSTRTGRRWLSRLGMSLPLIGPILKRNVIARWCDALGLGVNAGLDLPAAIELAGDTIDSPQLQADGAQLASALASGQTLDGIHSLSLLPPTIPAALHLGATNGNLPQTLATLSEMYQQQAELRMATLPAILTPLLTILMASLIAFVILAMFMPMIVFLRVISGGK